MTSKQQKLEFLRQYLSCRNSAPWVARCAEDEARAALQAIGGIAGTWRTDYSECTYYYPVLLGGRLVDLSTVEKVRDYYEREAATC